MTQPRHEVTLKKVLLTLDGMNALETRASEFPGADGQPLPLRTYHPANASSPAPAVVLVEGYPDPVFAPLLGCTFIDMEWNITTARLIAASGMVAVAYANREPADDLDALLAHLASHGGAMGIDAGRLGLWGASGHGPVALAAAKSVACTVLSNLYLCDLDGATHVAAAARTFGFAVPPGVELPHTPLFLIRSGRDETPGLNASLDRAVARAIAENLPLMLVNHHDAPHGFELDHDSEQTRAILRAALSFLRSHLNC